MIEPHNGKFLYWTCKKYSDHVFTTVGGVIPFECPMCGSRKICGCSRSWYETMKHNQMLAFKDYQLRTGDNDVGCYGRFIWSYYIINGGGRFAENNI